MGSRRHGRVSVSTGFPCNTMSPTKRDTGKPERRATGPWLRNVESLVNQAQVILFLWRIEEGWPVEYVSDNVSQLGYAAEGLTSGRVSWTGITHPDDRPRLEKEVEAFFADGIDEFAQTYRLLTPDGDVRWIDDRNRIIRDEQGNPTHVLGVIMDVTDQTLAQQKLEHNERMLRALSSNIPGMIYRAGSDWSVEYVTNSEPLCGYSCDELVGAEPGWLDVIHPGDKARVLAAAAGIERRTQELAQEYRIIARDGSVRWVEDRKRSHFSNGKFSGVDGAVFDVTERHRMEQEILEIGNHERQVIAQNLHDSLGQQLTGITLLAAALAMDVERGNASTADAKRLARLSKEAVHQVRQIAYGLFPVAIQEEGLAVPLRRLCRTTTDSMGVVCRCVIRKPGVVYDENTAMHLYHIAQEALNNAVRHGQPEHITVTLTTTHRGRLTVTDDGKGMPKRKHRKRGMGLRTMRYRAGMIGGNLTIRTPSGGGTRVIITFPNVPSEETGALPKP